MPASSILNPAPLSPEVPRSVLSGQPIEPPELRDFGDHRVTRNFIYDDVLNTANSLEPMVGKRYQLSLGNARYIDPPKFTRKKQKEAILHGDTLGRRLKGTWSLTDLQSGQVVDTRDQVVARVPFLTHRGTFIHRGNEYTVNNQQRLLPGIFTRRMNNGHLEAHMNILPGKGVSHRYFLDPESRVFKVKVGQAEMPLFPLIRAMGATDEQLREAWGNDLFAQNLRKDDPSVIKKLAARILRKGDASPDDVTTRSKLVAAFNSMELDGGVTKRTLGKSYDRLGLDAMLDTTKKLLAISRGEKEVDNRDDPAYQTFLGLEDFFVERLKKDHSKIRRNLLNKATQVGNLSRVPAGALTPQLEQLLIGSGLGSAIEEINPMEIYDKQSRITRLGEGGIPSTESIPDEARDVQSSHFGFIDPLRTPECYDEATEVLTDKGWKFWADAVADPQTRYAGQHEGRLVFEPATRLHAGMYDGIMYGVQSTFINYLVTPNHRMLIGPSYDAQFVLAEQLHNQDMYDDRRKWIFQTGGHLPLTGNHDYAIMDSHHEVCEVYQSACYAFRKRYLDELRHSDSWRRLDHAQEDSSWTTTTRLVAENVLRLFVSNGCGGRVCEKVDSDSGRAYSVRLLRKPYEVCLHELDPAVCLIYRKHYTGMVYCATVPGGLLYVRRHGSAGFWCGNSQAAGVDLNISRGARKGRDGRLYSRFNDVRTNKEVWKSPQDTADMVVAFPGYERSKAARVPAIQSGKIKYVKRSDIDLVLPHFEDAFSPLGNMVPLKSMVKGQRVAMASRMLTQALSLQNGQAPLVQGAMPGDRQRSFEDEYGKQLGAVRADKDGRVVGIDGDTIKVQFNDGTTDDIEMYNYFPFNRKSYLHQTALVKPGQSFKAGQPLVRSNFTDDKGAAALGLNARVAYMPWKGYNYEDAIVISEGMAKRLTSEHAYQHNVDTDERSRMGKKNYISLFPQKFDKKALENIDDDGIVRQGTVVKYGDPLILAAREKEYSAGKIHKKKQAGFNDSAVLWKHHDPGVVTDSVRGRNGPVVMVRSLAQMQVGDKMCFDDRSELLTRDHGWVRVTDLRHSHTLATLCGTTVEWHKPSHIWAYRHIGDMFKYTSPYVDMLVTPNHKLWVCDRDQHTFGELRADSFNDWVRSGNCFLSCDADLNLRQLVMDDRLGEMVHYNGIVYCITVTNHVVLVRRNGKVHWSHNSGRYGDKGVIAAIVPDHQMPTDRDGKAFEVLLNPLGVITRCYDDQTEFRTPNGWKLARDITVQEQLLMYDPYTGSTRLGLQLEPMHVSAYQGQLLTVETPKISLSVTPDHKMLGFIVNYEASSPLILPASEMAKGMWAVPVGESGERREVLTATNWVERYYDGMVYCPTVQTGFVVTRRNGKVVIAGNTNPAQMVEAALGKLAERTGKPIKVPDFDDVEDMTEWAYNLLKSSGVSNTEDVTIPELGMKVGAVATGNRFFMKLHHTAEGKLQGRGGGSYSAEETPSKGGETGCFVYDTPVSVLLDGQVQQVPLGWIVENKYELPILSGTGQKPSWQTINDFFRFDVPSCRLVEVVLANDRVLTLTTNHVVYLADGSTKMAGDLVEGDDLMEVCDA